MGMRALVVDDHAGFRTSARFLLEMEGFEVVGEAADCASALSAAMRLRPELVLLDVQLPDGQGFDVAREMLDPGRARPDRAHLEPGRVRLRRQHPRVRRGRLRAQGRAVGRADPCPAGRGPDMHLTDATLRRLAWLAFALCCVFLARGRGGRPRRRRSAAPVARTSPRPGRLRRDHLHVPGRRAPDRPAPTAQRRRVGHAGDRALRVPSYRPLRRVRAERPARVACRVPTSPQLCRRHLGRPTLGLVGTYLILLFPDGHLPSPTVALGRLVLRARRRLRLPDDHVHAGGARGRRAARRAPIRWACRSSVGWPTCCCPRSWSSRSASCCARRP